MTARRELADIQKKSSWPSIPHPMFWHHPMDLEIVKVLFLGFVWAFFGGGFFGGFLFFWGGGVWRVFLFCDCEGFLFFKMQYQPLTWFSKFLTKSMFTYIKMAFTLYNYLPEIRLKTHKNTINTVNTTFKGFVYFWFTNKGTQYFCLCLIKAHGFSICFQTFVPTAEKNITGKHTFFLVPNLNTSYC